MSQDNDKIFGPSGHGDYAEGDVITFLEKDAVMTGTVIHCTEAGSSPSGLYIPLTYEVDCEDGWPHIVSASQIIQA